MLGLGLGIPRRVAFGRRIWTPAALFAQGQQGVWYEPKPEYLFQDAAGTVPVVADGDPVGYMQDLSGNGNHATQSTSAARPIYRTDGVLHWLEADGADDFLATGKAVLSGVDYYLAHAMAPTRDEKLSLSFASSDSPDSSHVLFQDTRSSPMRLARVGGAAGSQFLSRTEKLSPGVPEVSSVERYMASGANGYINGVQVDALPSSSMGAAGDVTSLRIFSYSAIYAASSFYGGIVRNGVINNQDREAAENYLSALAGVTL